jgi:hypothetical protein
MSPFPKRSSPNAWTQVLERLKWRKTRLQGHPISRRDRFHSILGPLGWRYCKFNIEEYSVFQALCTMYYISQYNISVVVVFIYFLFVAAQFQVILELCSVLVDKDGSNVGQRAKAEVANRTASHDM